VATPDLDKTCSQLAAHGISPFKVWRFRPPVLFDRHFRGEEGDFTMDLAVAWAGNLQVEVVQPVSGSSLAAEFLVANGGPGLWHLMVGVKGSWKQRRDSMAGAFGEPAQSAAVSVPVRLGPVTIPAPPGNVLRSAGATRFAYFDSADALGTTLEIGKFPAGLSLRAASALGKPDEVLQGAGSITSGRISGLGIRVGDVSAAEQAWSRLLPGARWSSPSRNADEAGLVRRTGLAGIDLELYEPNDGVRGCYLRMDVGKDGRGSPSKGGVSGVTVFVDRDAK
jgi:hypothetical protein